ncbi:DUF5672 family protein [Phocaeicola vulgatus]|uniref:DUF5672 family protein n=2 Tax=Phocaeicola TaxID=909656 RepID=UPI00356436C5
MIINILKIISEFILKLCGFRNSLKYYATSFNLNEDMFFSLYANDVWLHPNVNLPLPDEAILFSFEVNPSFLYAKVQRLPFGCHAFEKFEFDSFWSQYISLL